MRPVKLKEIARWCGGTVLPQYEEIEVTGLIHDSREVEKGSLFFALLGETDGHKFVRSAYENGAAAAVCSKVLDEEIPQVLVPNTRLALAAIATEYRKTMNCRTVAITGSVGKTTTRTMVSAIMAEKYRTSSTIKNYNNDIGLPVTIGKSDPDCEMLVLELGMNHFGEMRHLTGIAQPDMVLITNIGSMHIENLGSREGILKAKLEILEGLREGGTAVFNGDEPLLWDLRERKDCKKVYFGTDNADCDVIGSNIQLLDGRSSFHVSGLGYSFDVALTVGGMHNIHNALAAITLCLLNDVSPEQICRALAAYVNTSQRQQTIQKNGYIIIDDTYNAGPESMEAALRVLGDTKGNREDYKRIAVLGDMLELGNHANAEHYRIGRLAVYMTDLLLTYGKRSGKMVEGAITGGMNQRNAMNFASQEELVNVLENRAKPGDVLLFKGSHGMHMDEVLKAFLESLE